MEHPSPSVASETLKILLKERGCKVGLAKKLRVPQYQVSKWLSGFRPMPKERAGIEDQVGLSWRLWDDEEVTAARISEALTAALTARPEGVEELRPRPGDTEQDEGDEPTPERH